MSATDVAITLACFLKFEAPDGNVLLSDGGMLEYDSEEYTAYDDVFGAVYEPEAIEAAFGDLAEDSTLILAPNPDATLTDWYRTDLENCRVRVWMGEVDSDGYTVSTAEQLGDYTVDTIERRQSASGQDLLVLGLIARTEKLFLKREGNVCSERFHKTVFSGEDGFNNCTDLRGYVAWGTESPRAAGAGGGGGFGGIDRGIAPRFRA